jgi:hypothetical protein
MYAIAYVIMFLPHFSHATEENDWNEDKPVFSTFLPA